MSKRTKRTLRVSGKVFLRLILATVLCAILYLSMMFIATGMFSDVTGYKIHEETENGDIILVEEHIYKAGEKHLSQLEVEDNQVLTETRVVPDKTLNVFHVLAQIMMLIVLAIFPYHIMWEFGNRDDTKVRYKGQRMDLLRGYRVGAFAMVPYAVLWVLLWLAKIGVLPNGYAQIYRLINIPFMPFINWLTYNGELQRMGVWQFVLLLSTLLYIPLICGVAYRLGHNQFSIREHLVFAKKEKQSDTEI